MARNERLEIPAEMRRVPSLNRLRMLEAAARHLSFTKAATELCVTQGAVSQQIKTLEDELGFAAFERRPTGLALTPKGRHLADGVRDSLEQIARLVASLGRDAPGPLVVSVLPSFASRWLIPRLVRFTAGNVQIIADNRLADLRTGGVDVALRYGPGSGPGIAGMRLMGDSIVPVCSPSLLARIGPVDLESLRSLPILHDSSTEGDGSGTDWASWLRAIGAPRMRLGVGQRFSQADLTLDAAASGLGIALARTRLAGDDLARQRLIRLPLPEVPTTYWYHLVCRPELTEDGRVVQFRNWLLSEVALLG